MPEFFNHLVLCNGCSIPMDEMPDSQKEWEVLTTTLMCPATTDCPGHVVRTQVFCLPCQAKGKHLDHSEANHPSPPSAPGHRV